MGSGAVRLGVSLAAVADLSGIDRAILSLAENGRLIHRGRVPGRPDALRRVASEEGHHVSKVLNPAVRRRYEDQLRRAEELKDRAAVLILQGKLEADAVARRTN